MSGELPIRKLLVVFKVRNDDGSEQHVALLGVRNSQSLDNFCRLN